MFLSGQALDQAAQGSGGVPIPGGVQKTCGWGTSRHGLAGIVVLGWRLTLMILEVFSNLNDSVILWFCECSKLGGYKVVFVTFFHGFPVAEAAMGELSSPIIHSSSWAALPFPFLGSSQVSHGHPSVAGQPWQRHPWLLAKPWPARGDGHACSPRMPLQACLSCCY